MQQTHKTERIFSDRPVKVTVNVTLRSKRESTIPQSCYTTYVSLPKIRLYTLRN